MPILFDTQKQHQVLVEAGFADPQAQAITTVALAAIDAVATKTDIERLDTRLDGMEKRLDDFRALGIALFGAVLGLYGAIFLVLAPHLR